MAQTLLNSCPSICIPRVFNNITADRIRDVFTELFGADGIDRIDMVGRTSNDGTKYWRVFIHFNAYHGDVGATVRERLDAGETVKIVYDDPWFWKCSKSRVNKPKGARRERQAPYIERAQPATSPRRVTALEEGEVATVPRRRRLAVTTDVSATEEG